MATVRKLEVISNKFHVLRACSSQDAVAAVDDDDDDGDDDDDDSCIRRSKMRHQMQL